MFLSNEFDDVTIRIYQFFSSTIEVSEYMYEVM